MTAKTLKRSSRGPQDQEILKRFVTKGYDSDIKTYFQTLTVIEDSKFVESYHSSGHQSTVTREIQGDALLVVSI